MQEPAARMIGEKQPSENGDWWRHWSVKKSESRWGSVTPR